MVLGCFAVPAAHSSGGFKKEKKKTTTVDRLEKLVLGITKGKTNHLRRISTEWSGSGFTAFCGFLYVK